MNQLTPMPFVDLHALRQALDCGKTSVGEILEQSLAIARSDACRHAFMPGQTDIAHEPSAITAMKGGVSALAGIPVSIKDLFDVAGQVTAAGSTVLATAPAAHSDCIAVARLRASGAAVSVATGAAFVGLGSDTGGSIRIPAALCGIVGFKSTARCVPATGAVPLSTSLDTVCALTRSVRDAVTVHEVLSDRRVLLAGKPLSACRLAVARTQMQDGLGSSVAKAFEQSLQVLRQAGAQIEEIGLNEIDELGSINATGGLSAAESYAWHRKLIAAHEAQYDPRVAQRILRGARMSAADYIDLLAARQDWITRMQARLRRFDAVLSPTVPIVAPSIASVLTDNDEFFRINALLLRNTSVVNMLDGCAISIPCHTPGQLPVGLMIWHAALHDDALLDLALQVESVLADALQK